MQIEAATVEALPLDRLLAMSQDSLWEKETKWKGEAIAAILFLQRAYQRSTRASKVDTRVIQWAPELRGQNRISVRFRSHLALCEPCSSRRCIATRGMSRRCPCAASFSADWLKTAVLAVISPSSGKSCATPLRGQLAESSHPDCPPYPAAENKNVSVKVAATRQCFHVESYLLSGKVDQGGRYVRLAAG
jgi:hypothetical protein